MGISRRDFIASAAVTGIAAAAVSPKAGAIPTRVLGKTGVRVSQLVFGSGSRWLMYEEESKAAEAMLKALDLGINYVDTAFGYGNGKSEERIGRILKDRRKDIFLATKINVRPGDEAKRMIEGSLKRLQTDHLDLMHIHSLTTPQDLAQIEAKGNVLDVLHQMREQKVTRFIGITCHTDPAVLKTALERHDFDVTQFALNAGQMGMAKVDTKESFQDLALPAANRKQMGVIAMKIFLQEKLNDKATPEQLIRYSLSLPVTAVVVGMPKLEHIEENVRIATSFRPMPAVEMRDLTQRLQGSMRASLHTFERDHFDC